MKQLIRARNGVVIFVEDSEGVIFVRQYREAAKEYLLELPGGGIDDGESPEAAAVRELEEEVGLIATELKRVGSFFSNPSVSTNEIHIFIATKLKQSTRRSQDEELVEVVRLKRDRLENQVFRDAKTIAALGLLNFKVFSC